MGLVNAILKTLGSPAASSNVFHPPEVRKVSQSFAHRKHEQDEEKRKIPGQTELQNQKPAELHCFKQVDEMGQPQASLGLSFVK